MPRLIRLYIVQCFRGFLIAAAFVVGLLWFDVARLGDLVVQSEDGILAVFLMWAHLGLIFAAVQFAISVMSLAGTDPDDDRPDDDRPDDDRPGNDRPGGGAVRRGALVRSRLAGRRGAVVAGRTRIPKVGASSGRG
jgi:hypothetical protein